MPNTPVFALPYPSATDTADVPRDIQALGVRLDAVLRPALVTSLPGSPVDGQECYFLADATLGIVWHLRYRSASASSFKWEVIGGPPLLAEQSADAPGWTNTGYATIAPACQVTVPLAGDYIIQHTGQVWNSTTTAGVYSAVKLGAAATADNDGWHTTSGVANTAQPGGTIIRRTAAANDVVVIQQKTLSGTAGTRLRRLSVVPARVG